MRGGGEEADPVPDKKFIFSIKLRVEASLIDI